MLYLVLGGLFYLYLGMCVGGELFDKDDSLAGLLFTLFACLIWPITLAGIAMYKFTRWLNKL